ncbi:hypothetical protein N1851_023601 [Merluccius polli]|uniref:SGNH hydrolase-type esterase domain-containing protein n=1 Tax=Merluccius polli TaxID=89951 RepID=A0AA47NUX8_MERPO|nr:hypothetical protein N1851_023601 [Merluccius polli]
MIDCLQVIDLKDDVRRLSRELRRKEDLLQQSLDVAHEQSLRMSSLSAALQDTVPWDPTGQRPSRSWTRVTHGRQRTPPGAVSPPIPLSNHYEALSQLAGAPCDGRGPGSAPPTGAASTASLPGGAPPPRPAGPSPSGGSKAATLHHQVGSASPTQSSGGPDSRSAAACVVPPLTDTTAFPPLAARCPPAGGHQTRGCPPPLPSSSSQRRRLVEDAVRWRSSRSRSSHQARDHTRGPGVGGGVAELACPPDNRAVAPTTLVIGDSIVRHVRMRGAFTMAFPGATVADITGKIPDILSSHPQARRIIIHAGANDIARQQSELLKQGFINLFNSVSQSQVTVFISGPTPTCGRGIGSFSRLLSLNTWLSSVCSSHQVGFVNNFDVFWERRHLFGSDGLHLNRAGARMLAANLAYGCSSGGSSTLGSVSGLLLGALSLGPFGSAGCGLSGSGGLGAGAPGGTACRSSQCGRPQRWRFLNPQCHAMAP